MAESPTKSGVKGRVEKYEQDLKTVPDEKNRSLSTSSTKESMFITTDVKSTMERFVKNEPDEKNRSLSNSSANETMFISADVKSKVEHLDKNVKLESQVGGFMRKGP